MVAVSHRIQETLAGSRTMTRLKVSLLEKFENRANRGSVRHCQLLTHKRETLICDTVIVGHTDQKHSLVSRSIITTKKIVIVHRKTDCQVDHKPLEVREHLKDPSTV